MRVDQPFSAVGPSQLQFPQLCVEPGLFPRPGGAPQCVRVQHFGHARPNRTPLACLTPHADACLSVGRRGLRSAFRKRERRAAAASRHGVHPTRTSSRTMAASSSGTSSTTARNLRSDHSQTAIIRGDVRATESPTSENRAREWQGSRRRRPPSQHVSTSDVSRIADLVLQAFAHKVLQVASGCGLGWPRRLYLLDGRRLYTHLL